MKRLRWIYLALFLPLANLSAGYYPATGGCNDTWVCDPVYPKPEKRIGRFDFTAEALIWFNMCLDINYAYQGTVLGELPTDGTHLKPKSLNAEWTPGFRLTMEANEALGEIDFSCSYTFSHTYWRKLIKNTNDDDVIVQNAGWIISSIVPPDIQDGNLINTMNTSYKLKYQSFDLLLSYKCHSGRCHTLTPFMGFEGVFTRLKFGHTAEEVSGVLTGSWEGDFEGYGLKVGSKYSFSSCENYELFVKTSGSLLVSGYDAKAYYENTAGSGSYLTLHESRCCNFVPGWHLQLGFLYHDCFCGSYFNAFFGYEFLQWLGMPRPKEMQEASSVSTNFVQTDKVMGYQGIFCGFTWGF